MGLMKGGGGGNGVGGGGGSGEIVQVQGGHIVRATGRKDRHSKVYTSKGPRDRRVRLSAHTAIQFYDVQDRLGFDRPSKAVDWLIKKAKSSIDKLVELPPWELPSMDPLAAPPPPQPPEFPPPNGRVDSVEAGRDGRGSESPDDGYDFSIHRETGMDLRSSAASCSSSLFQSQLDTMPFLGTSSAMGASSSINFDDYHRSSTNQDLGLSLHPFQAPSFAPQHEDPINQAAIFPMTADDPRFMFNPAPPPLAQPLFLSQTQSRAGFLQRGTLQSSYAAPPPRSYEEFQPIELSSSSSPAHHHHSHHPSMLGGSRFAADPGGGFPGFCLQSQMQQDDEEREGLFCRPLLSRVMAADETSPVSSVPSSLAG